MKKILYSLVVCAGVLSFTACDNSVEDNSRLTYLVDLQLEKDTIEHQVNTEFTAPKFTATENGVDVSSKVTVKGLDKVDETKIGIYPISYATANADGIAASAKQTVYVVNAAADTDISGDYSIDTEGSYCLNGTERIYFPSAYPLKVTKVATGIFTISDMLGGWMNLKEGKGTDFALEADYFLENAIEAGTTTVNTSDLTGLASNEMIIEDDDEEKPVTISNLQIRVEADEIKETYTLSWTAEYDGREIYVVATTEKKIESEEE